MTSILISHTDLDGLGSVVLKELYELSFDSVHLFDYGFTDTPEGLQVLSTADVITMADISIAEDLFDSLVAQGKYVQIFDHHDSSQWLNGKANCICDTSRCGTKIFFEEYVLPRIGTCKPIVRQFVELIDVYDRWVLDSPLRPDSENLQRVWTSYVNWKDPDMLRKNERFITQMVRHLESQETFSWNITERAFIEKTIVKENMFYNEAVASIIDRVDYKGRRFGVFAAMGKISVTCARLFKEYPSRWEYLVVLQSGYGGWGKFSFRAKDTMDVTTLAGVNGHKAAAGLQLSPELADEFFEKNLCFKDKDEYTEGDSYFTECLSPSSTQNGMTNNRS